MSTPTGGQLTDSRARPPTRSTMQLQPHTEQSRIVQHVEELTKGVPKFLTGCTFCLENTSESTDMLRNLLKKLGATVVSMYKDSCTHLLTPYQKGNYQKAVQDKKIIVTTEWLEDCINVHGVVPLILTEFHATRIYNPIYYPVKSYHIPEFLNLKFTLTGFLKIEKRRLTYLIMSTGAQCTGNMTKENTHLIYKKAAGDKFVVAKQWEIKRANKDWLFECIRQWRLIPIPASEANTTVSTSNEVNENNKRPLEESPNGDAKRIKLDSEAEEITSSGDGDQFVVVRGKGEEVKNLCKTLQRHNSLILYSNKTTSEFPQLSQFLRGELDRETVMAEASTTSALVELDDTKLEEIKDQNQDLLFVAPFERPQPKQDGIFKPRSTGLVYDARMCLHDGPYPESPLRISAIWNSLEENHLTEKCFVMKSREASLQELITVHSNQYVQDFFSLKGQFNPQENNKKLSEGILEDDSILHDESTDIRVNQYTLKAARLSAGGVIKMCEKVVEGQLENGFAIVRPPGHHARPAEPMGFCFFNNVAVAARVIQNRYKHINRVLIVDFDIHHGNGTQDIFEDDPSVLYISLHRMEGDYFPGTGHVEEVGTGAGAGYTVNIPLPPKGAKMGPLATINDVDYLTVFNHVIMPISLEFAPDLVLVSAGFDAAKGDLLGKRMALSPTGFAHMISIMKTWAGGRIVLALEGGYNTDVTAQCATACLKVLLGEDPPNLPGKVASPATYQAIKQVVQHHHKYWKSLQIFAETFMGGNSRNNYLFEPPKEEKPTIDWTIKPETKTYVIDINGSGDYTTINEALHEAVKLSPTYAEYQQHKPPHRGKIIVKVLPGSYKTKLTLDNTLTHRDIEIVGVGERDKIVIEYNGAFARINGPHSISIKGVTFRSTDDFSKPQPSLEETTFRFTNGAVDVEISDCVFQGVSLIVEANCRVQISDSIISFASKRAISVQGQAQAILNKNHITNNGIGILVYMGGTLNAKENSIFSNAEYGILGYNPKGLVEGNSIYMNGLSGIQLLQGSIRIANNKIYNQVQAGIVINNNCTATIENNLIYSNAYSGIESGMNSKPIIRNNEIYNGRQSGILIVTKAAGLIEGNKIYGNGFAGVEVREGNPTIKANQIYNQKQAGIGIHGGQSLSTIEGNDIYANEYANIEVKLYGNPTVTNNKIHNGKQHGVLVFEYGRGRFESNDIYDNNFDGFITQSGGEPTVLSNQIHNNGKNGINLGADGKGNYESNDIYANKENGVKIISNASAKFEKNSIHDHQDATHGYGIATHYEHACTLTDNIFANNRVETVSSFDVHKTETPTPTPIVVNDINNTPPTSQ